MGGAKQGSKRGGKNTEGAASGRSGRSGEESSENGRPPWLIPAAIGVSVLLILGLIFRSCVSGGSGYDASDCMADLVEHFGADSGDLLVGTDLPRARDAGYSDAESLNDVGESLQAAGALADPVTDRYRYQRLVGPDAFQAGTGVATDDIRCSLSVGDGGEIAALSASFEVAVLAGSFDAAEVNGSAAGAAGELAADDERLAMVLAGDAGALLEIPEENLSTDEELMLVIDHLLDSDVHSFVVQRAPDDDNGNDNGNGNGDGDGDGEDESGGDGSGLVAAGFGVGRDGDDATLVAAWVFADDDAAAEARPAVTDAVNEMATGSASIRGADLELDENVVRLEIPTREALDLTELIRRHGGPMGPLAQ